MKRVLNFVLLSAFGFIMVLSCGCTDPQAIIDQNTPVADHNWGYLNKYKYTVKIDDEKAAYNLYMNLRVTADYKYSNLFVLITQTGPDKKSKTSRYELKLANKDGEWLGVGSGNLYSYQETFRTKYKFPAKGAYIFEIEQNMRNNPLRDVSDVGLRAEKAQ